MRLFGWNTKSTKSTDIAERDLSYPIPFQQYVSDYLSFDGINYPVAGMRQTLLGQREEIGSDYSSMAGSAYRANAIVFACMQARMLHFSEARFIYRDRGTGKRFGRDANALRILANPWPGGTTQDLLARMIQDVDLAGNAYIVRQGDRLARLRPDWVVIVLGSRTRRSEWVAGDPDTEVVGYVYYPGGKASGRDELRFLPDEVAHFAPTPDPQATYRGMSWLTPLIREIQGDLMMSQHKNKYFEQGATVNLVVKVPAGVSQQNFLDLKEALDGNHAGVQNAYRTLYLAGGADVTPVGSNMKDIDFANVQAYGETRIAAAARVPVTILGFSEGLKGSSLNAGNYQMARRNLADGLMRPLWSSAAGSLEHLVEVPGGAELWYDERDVAFLKEDLKDAAEVMQANSVAIQNYVNSGYTPESAVAAVDADDLTLLDHSGLISVQLHDPNETPAPGANANGNGNLPVPNQEGASNGRQP